VFEYFISSGLWIQLFGALGYGLYVGSGFFQKRFMILLAELFGGVIVAVQWVLLDAPSVAAMNFLFAYTALMGILVVHFPRAKYFYMLNVPMAVVLLALLGQGSSYDILVFVASLPYLCAKYFRDVFKLRVISMSGSLMWLIINTSMGSIPGMFCSLGYIISHGWSCLRMWPEIKKTKALSPA